MSHLLQACAPRFVYFSINMRQLEPVGTCFTAMDSFSRFSEYSPCRTGIIAVTQIHENANYELKEPSMLNLLLKATHVKYKTELIRA